MLNAWCASHPNAPDSIEGNTGPGHFPKNAPIPQATTSRPDTCQSPFKEPDLGQPPRMPRNVRHNTEHKNDIRQSPLKETDLGQPSRCPDMSHTTRKTRRHLSAPFKEGQ